MSILLDGKKTSAKIKQKIKERIFQSSCSERPGLAVILVGQNPASCVYVAMKKKACQEVGIHSFEYCLDVDVSQEKLQDCIETLNVDSRVHGILLQLPLPSHINEGMMLQRISPEKDVDGFHPINVGKLVIGESCFIPCTPLGIQRLLEDYNISIQGKHVVIVGRSRIVGKPVGMLLLQRGVFADATVTFCHSKSHNLSAMTRQADILIAAIGKPSYITEDMEKEGAVIIDVGINRVSDSSHPKGSRLIGDVDFHAVSRKASAITPVPGGIGPMTIAMLLSNTLQASGIA